MVHGHRTSRSAERRGPCATVLVALLAMTLLHTLLSLGASPTPPADLGYCGALRAPAPVPAAPRAEEESSDASRPAAQPVRDAYGHPAGHAGHAGHVGRTCATSAPGARSAPTAPGHVVLAAVRGRLADHTSGTGISVAGSETPAAQFSSRSVVLRC
ncbi:hypothetical protein HUT19_37830 [Streptomyces sp. NA02950]|uniref:hypothetical protein n=1 Tax=Streptomyces sp. NA02950 TaxID=2742137 RepID=UPI001590E269|nr:hypothetical protein [Streptomyces sp. NA02950]QKV96750.1 hypothetical protein HUT19_37830 [Streptomyces sp. NA02950]